jgi:hypothetical protein
MPPDRKGGYCIDCARAYNARYRKNNREKILGNQKRWRDKSGDVAKDANKAFRQDEIKSLGDRYIKHLLTQNTALKFDDVPQMMVEAKRQQMLIWREIRRFENEKC